MISSGQVNFGENSFALQISIEIANVRDGIAVVYGAALRYLKSPHGCQPPPGLGMICKGDDHGELDLRINAQVLHLLELGLGNS